MTNRVPEIVQFKNAQGNNLFGMYHNPSSTAALVRRTAVVLLSPGVKMRVGPHRLYLTMAEYFTDLGFPVFRFDFWGLGDSEGECPEELLPDLYSHVQIGRYIQDTKDAMDWLSREKSINQFVLGGLCGGAITALLTAAEDHRCTGLLSLGIPVILDSAEIDQRLYMTNRQRTATRNAYLKKIFSPKAWLRVLSLKSDFKLIWRSFFKAKSQGRSTEGQGGNEQGLSSNVNPFFAPKFFEFVNRGCPVLLIFSGKDRLVHEYQEKFASKYKERLNEAKEILTFHVVPNANHILSRWEWKREMLEHACSWLDHFD